MKNKNPSPKTVLISSIPGINCFFFYQQRLAPGVQSIMLNLTSHKLHYNNAALTKCLADLMLTVMDRTSRASFSQYSYRTCIGFPYRKMFYLPNVACFSSAVFRTLRIWDPVASCVLHGPVHARAPQPSALYAYAQAHHHPGMQHGQLQHRETYCAAHFEPHRYTATPQYPSKSNRGRYHPSDLTYHHSNPSVQLVQIKSYHQVSDAAETWN